MAYNAVSSLSLCLWEGGGEIEVEAVITYTVSPYFSATLYAPAEPSEATVTSFRLFKGKDELAVPTWLEEAFLDDEAFHSWLLSEAADSDQSAREDAADHRREMLREDQP